jgi:hypothetical protein
MFGMDKIKDASKDPEKAMEYADKKLNKGMSGFMTKAFMGKDFVNDMNTTMEKGREAMDMAKAYQDPSSYNFAVDSTAVVVSIQDTGGSVNDNPIVVMQLKVQSAAGIPFDMTAQAMVSRIAVPRAGDTIKIKYNPADMTKVLVVQ